jgi:antitoxin component HigA of HigAB toxin-antitoxin module
LRALTIHRIRTEAEYRATLKEISALVDADPDLGTPAGDRLNALVSQDYELLCVPIDAGLVDRIRLLTAGIEVDLDQPLPPELDDAGLS